MAVQIRSKRKKNFKSNEGMQFDAPTTPASSGRRVDKSYESNLNVRRSSRKPKPKKIDNDFEDDVPTEIKIKQEPVDEDEDNNTPTVYMTETPVFDIFPDNATASFVSPPSAAGVRRETRKSFQSYLETLGYNSDFSKISAQEQQAETWKKSRKSPGRKPSLSVKTEPDENFTLLSSNDQTSGKTNTVPKVRASSRTPKPRKTFSLLEEGETSEQPSSIIGLGSVEPTDMHLDAQSKSSRKIELRKSASGSEKVKTSTMQPKPSSALGKNEVDQPDVMSDETDGTPTRTSRRVRVPKRQFSLLEDEMQSDVKRQKVMSPEHITSPEVKKGKQKENTIIATPSENKVAAQSLIVVKRSNVKQKQRKKKKEQNGNTLDPCPRKVKKIIEDIHIKREVDTTQSSQLETEKKTVAKKGRERIEKIVQSLKLAKQSDEVSTQQDDKTPTHQQGVKRKRESNEETKKSGKGVKKAKTEPEKDHIVLKLSIPHGKNKGKAKHVEKHHHHKHHHHHKVKKTKASENIIKKKEKKKSTTDVKNLKKGKPKMAAKKKVKKMKVNIKQEPDDSSSHPHVKLIIKKSPTKETKIAEVMMQDMSQGESSELAAGSMEDSKETVRLTKADIKKKPSTKKYKPLSVKPLVSKPFKKVNEKKDKTTKTRTVSAYSLFTKNRRKGLLEKEPDLDFASTSRRLAQMWKNLPDADQEYWKAKARAVRMPNGREPTRSFLRTKKSRYDSYNWSHFSDVPASSSTGTEAIDMAAYLKLLGESLCSIGMCLKRQDQMEVHGSLSVLLDTALCSIVPVFCLTSQLPEMAGCSHETQAQILDNLAYIIPGL